MDSPTLFSQTPPVRLFFFAAIPGALSMLASSLYYTLDGVFVGQFIGAMAFAAINLAMPFVIINFSLADLIGVGASVPISIALGRGDKKEANNIFTCACLLIHALGILIGAALFAAAPLLIRFLGADGEFAAMAVEYLRVYALCSPLTTAMFAMDNFLRISGFIRGSLALNILMSVLCAKNSGRRMPEQRPLPDPPRKKSTRKPSTTCSSTTSKLRNNRDTHVYVSTLQKDVKRTFLLKSVQQN